MIDINIIYSNTKIIFSMISFGIFIESVVEYLNHAK